MKYWPPYGASDANAPWANGNPAAGQRGSIIDAREVEQTQRELVNLVTDAGLVPSGSDLRQVGKAIQSGQLISAADSGTANTLAVQLTPTPPGYVSGLLIVVKVGNDNTGASTINVNGMGAKQIVRPDGVALRARDLIAGAVVLLIYDGSRFQLAGAQINALTAPRTYYCSPSGSDNNNGLSNATPFRQITKAISAAAIFNQNGFDVRIEAANGAYNPLSLDVPNGNGTIDIVGNVATPGSCQIAATTGPAIRAFASRGFTLRGFKLMSAAGTAALPGSGIWTSGGSVLNIADIEWGACADHHMTNDASQIEMTGKMIISGSAYAHAFGGDGCRFRSNTPNDPTLIIPNAVSIEAFLNLSVLGSSQLVYDSITGAGNVTGKKFIATGNSVINTKGAGSSYYPGTIAGETQSGGQYL